MLGLFNFGKNHVVNIVNKVNGEKRSLKYKHAQPLLESGDWELQEGQNPAAAPGPEATNTGDNTAEGAESTTNAGEITASSSEGDDKPAETIAATTIQPKVEDKKPAAVATTSVTNVVLDKPEDTSTDKKRSQKMVKYKFNDNAKKFFKPGHVESITEENAAIFNKKQFGEIVP